MPYLISILFDIGKMQLDIAYSSVVSHILKLRDKEHNTKSLSTLGLYKSSKISTN